MPLIVIMVIVIGAFFAGSKSTIQNNRPIVAEKQQTQVLQTPTPTPTSIPQAKEQAVQTEPVIDCVGPDGGHLRITQKECDSFSNAWKKTQPSNTPSVPAQISTQTGSSTEPLVTCVLSYGTYQLTRATCDSWKSTDKPYIPPKFYPCTICYSTLGTCYSYDSLYKTKEECDAAQYSGNLPTPQPTADPAIVQYFIEKYQKYSREQQDQQCKQVIQSWEDKQAELRNKKYSNSADQAREFIYSQDQYYQQRKEACGY